MFARHAALFPLVVLVAWTVGCENPNTQMSARSEAPYTPPYEARSSRAAPAASEDWMSSPPAVADDYDAAPYESTDAESPTFTSKASAPGSDAPPASYASYASASRDESLSPTGDAPPGAWVYVVRKGDTLYKIARTFYRHDGRWREIWEANKTRVPDPNHLPVGMKLIIP